MGAYLIWPSVARLGEAQSDPPVEGFLPVFACPHALGRWFESLPACHYFAVAGELRRFAASGFFASRRHSFRSCAVRINRAVTAFGDMSGFAIVALLERANIVEILAARTQPLHLDQACAGDDREFTVLPPHALPSGHRLQVSRHEKEVDAEQIARGAYTSRRFIGARIASPGHGARCLLAL